MPTKRAPRRQLKVARSKRGAAPRRGRTGRGRPGLDRATVLAAAREIADRGGLDALTLRAIAEHFGVKPPSLYNHIEGLDSVRRELALEGTRLLGQRFARATAGIAKDAAVRAIARVYREFAHEHPGLYQASLGAPRRDDPEASAAATDTAEIVFAVLSGYGLQADDLVHATRALRAAMHGFVSLEHAGGFGIPLDLEQSYERTVALVLAGLNAT